MNDFMNGRRGVDELTTTLGGASMVLALIGSIFSISWLGWIALVAVIVALLRAFSTNIAARERENDAFRDLLAKTPLAGSMRGSRPRSSYPQDAAAPGASSFDRKKRTAQTMWENRKTTMYFKCKNCGQLLSVPRGKGRIRVTCPKCGTKVEKRS